MLKVLAGLLLLGMTAAVTAQTPQPFPRPGTAPPPPPAPSKPASGTTPGTPAATPAPPTPELGEIPLYPNAAYLGSYDAGRGQKFHLYGVKLPYAEAVAFYRAALKQRGDELFESPPTHQFDLGRFRDDQMSFPPSVTIKDYTWGGSPGYMHPKLGTPERFPTVIQIVPPPAVAR